MSADGFGGGGFSAGGGGAVGPTGPTGPAGATGATGPQGAVGPTGPQGDAGATGAIGPTGPAGSANISGTTNKVIRFTGTTTGGDSAITDDGTNVTSTRPVTAQVDNVTTTDTVGLAVRNTTAATASVTVQRSPQSVTEAHAWISSADTKFLVRTVLVPTTSNTYQHRWDRSKDGGGSYTTPLYFTDSTPGQFVGALMSPSGYSTTGDTLGFFDADRSGVFRGTVISGALEFLGRATTVPVLLRSPTTTSGQANWRLWANVAPRAATEALIELCDGAVSATRRFAIMGDYVIENPRFHTDTAVKTGTFSAVVHTAYMIDLVGVATANIAAATSANIGAQIQFSQVGAGASVFTVTPASGTIEGQATFTMTGVALITSAIPGISITIQSFGAGAGSPGWKVV